MVEEVVGVLILRWLTALAGLIVAICAYHRASRRVDVPNQVLGEVAKLKADLKSLTSSVEQTLGAYEDRFTSWQKRQAAYVSGPRRPNAVIEAEAAGKVEANGPVIEQQPTPSERRRAAPPVAVNPRVTRAAIRAARVGRERGI